MKKCNIFYRLGMVKGFDFVVNSYWPEVEERLQLNLASIYAPGNPDNFFLVSIYIYKHVSYFFFTYLFEQ